MVKIAGEISWAQLEDEVRQVSMLVPNEDGELIFPYADARITLDEIPYAEVRPTTLYVIQADLAFQSELTTYLATEGYDPLNLDGALVLEDETGTKTGLIPPLVEETDDGTCLVDGAHRTYLGYMLGREVFRAIHIEGVRKDCPVYAYPNEWGEIIVHDRVPENPEDKKRYRVDDYRKFYRDFSQLNGSQLRSDPVSK